MGKERELKAITANRVSPVIILVLLAVEGAVVEEYLFLYSIPKHKFRSNILDTVRQRS